jgi:hypothetical protein
MTKTAAFPRLLAATVTVLLAAAWVSFAPPPSASAASHRYFSGTTSIHESKYTGPRALTGGRTNVVSNYFIARVYTVTSGFVPYAGSTGVSIATLSHGTLTNHRTTCSWAMDYYVTGVLQLYCDTHY